MVNRILKILKEENLTASQFADAIDVQRSSMSHILSGRNNPSLDFVNKILKAFPLLNTDWLMSGTGSMYKSEKKDNEVISVEQTTMGKNTSSDLFNLFDSVEQVEPKKENLNSEKDKKIDLFDLETNIVRSEEPAKYGISHYKSNDYDQKNELKTHSESNIFDKTVPPAEKMNSPKDIPIEENDKKVEQIVIFYSDKTFSVYRPE